MSIAGAAPFNIADVPLFLPGTVPPLNMLVMGRDHRMYYEAYNDASDLDDDGELDSRLQARRDHYYGYFDSNKLLHVRRRPVHADGPSRAAAKTCGRRHGVERRLAQLRDDEPHRCDAQGALRRPALDGHRTETVLQRPSSRRTRIAGARNTRASRSTATTSPATRRSACPLPGGATFSPTRRPRPTPCVQHESRDQRRAVALFRVLKINRTTESGNWVSIERPVAGTAIVTGIKAAAKSRPPSTPPTTSCASRCAERALDPLETNCKSYGSELKAHRLAAGLRRERHDAVRPAHGLLRKPHDGGVLRKAVASIRTRSISTTGQIRHCSTPPGIINTIDRLRITSFNRDAATAAAGSATSSDAAGSCSMWGNPIAEMMYETVRYFAGKAAPTSDVRYNGANQCRGDVDRPQRAPPGTAPRIRTAPRRCSCAKPFQTVISDMSPSYDSDRVPGQRLRRLDGSDVTGIDATSARQRHLGRRSRRPRAPYFIGQSGGTYDGAPTPKTVNSFANDSRAVARSADQGRQLQRRQRRALRR